MTYSEHAPRGSISQFFHELDEGARRQGNIVFALMFLQLKTKSQGGGEGYGMLSLIGTLLEPASYVATLALFWYLLGRTSIGGVPVMLFLTVSVTAFAMFRRSLSTIPRSIKGTRPFYAFPKVKPFDAVLARFIVELLLTVVGGCLLQFCLWWFYDMTIRIDHFMEAMGVFFMLVAAAFGISLFLGTYGTRFSFIFRMVSMSSRGLMFVSAVMHPATQLPAFAQTFLAWNPIAHAMELIRWYLLGIKPFQRVSFEYLAIFCVISVFLGFTGYYVNRHKVLEE